MKKWLIERSVPEPKYFVGPNDWNADVALATRYNSAAEAQAIVDRDLKGVPVTVVEHTF